MRTFVLFLFSTIYFYCNGQTPFDWARTGGGIPNDEGKSIAVDSNGNVYTTGYFQGTTDFDPGPGVYNVTSSGQNDIFILKLDAFGNLIWVKTIGGNGTDMGNSLVLDTSGSVYITGKFYGLVDFDPNAGVLNLGATFGSFAFIMKLDGTGNLMWAKYLDGTTVGIDMELDQYGKIYVTGSFNGTADFDPGPAVYTLTCTSSSFGYVLKLDNSGNFIFAKSFTSTNQFDPTAIAVDFSGNIYTTGTWRGTADLDPSPSTYTIMPVGYSDMFMSKLDSLGSFVWGKTIQGQNDETPLGLVVDNNANLYFTGHFSNQVDFNPGTGVYYLGYNGMNTTDIFVLKLNTAGNFLWVKQIGSGSSDMGIAVTLDSFKNVVTTGVFSGGVDFDPGPGTLNLTAPFNTYGTYIMQLDSLGNFLQAKAITGGSTFGQSITTGGLSNIYTTGFFGGTTDFDPEATTYTLATVGGNDFFVHKMNFCIASSVPTVTNICYGGNTGAINLNVYGVAPFTFSWSPVANNTASLSSLAAGIYTVIINSGCNMTTTQTIQVTQPQTLSVTIAATSSTICVGKTTTLTASTSGGTGFINNFWSVGYFGSPIVISPTTTSSYTVTSTDANSCQATNSITITVNPLPTVSISNSNPIICSGQQVLLTGSGATTYTWSNANSNSSIIITPTIIGTYTVTGSDVNFCSNFAVTTISVNPVPTITISGGSTAICMGNTVALLASGANSYTWSNGVINNIPFTPTSTTNYTITGTSSNGCTSSASTGITVYSLPVISAVSSSQPLCLLDTAIITASGALTYTWSNSSNGSTISVTPFASTSYTVTGTDVNSCISSTLINLTVNNLPTLTISVTSPTICFGNVVTLSATGANTYVWSSGIVNNTPFTPTVTVNYTVTGTDVNGCKGFASQSITVNPLPQLTASSNQSLICEGQSATLTASGANSYVWNTGSNTPLILISPTLTTNYTVTGTDINGCTNIATITQSVSACTSMNELIASESNTEIYPNPFMQKFNLEFSEEVKETIISIYNTNGQLVFSQNYFSDRIISVHAADLPLGLFFVEVNADGKISRHKIVKE